MIDVGLDVSELAAFGEDIALVAKLIPKETDRFMRREASKLTRRTRAVARRTLKKHKKPKKYKASKHYVDTIHRGKPYYYLGSKVKAIRVYSYARHAHLIEFGHRVVRKDAKGTEHVVGHAAAHPVFQPARDAFVSVFADDCDSWIDDAIRGIRK